MKKHIRILIALMTLAAMCLTLAACKKDAAPDTAEVTQDQMEYMSPDGWRVVYDPEVMESAEIDDHAAQFVYIGESAGTNMVEISYIADKQPEEVLYDVTSEWGNDDAIERTEGFFPGTDDKWGYWRSLAAEEGSSGLGMTAIAGEYNDGVLLFVVTDHMSGNDETDMAVSDALSEVIDSITYENFQDQTMYEYYPGTYEATSDKGDFRTVELKKDHTGTLTNRNGRKTDIVWGSIEVTAADNAFTYGLDIEGTNLYLGIDDDWIEFAK